MNWNRSVALAKGTAIVAGAIAAVGTGIGLYDAGVNPIIAVLVGVGLCVVLVMGHHLIIDGAANARRGGGIAAALIGSFLLCCIALAASGWSLATVLGGPSAQSSYRLDAVIEHEAALNAAHAGLRDQQVVLDLASQASAGFTSYAEREARGDFGTAGCGPNCQEYASAGQGMNRLHGDMEGRMRQALDRHAAAQRALGEARRNIHDDEIFADRLAFVNSVTSEISAIDFGRDVAASGMLVVSSDRSGPTSVRTDNLTGQLMDAAAQIDSHPVELPVYVPITDADAVIQRPDKSLSGWLIAGAVDFAPFLIALLVFFFAREPLMRQAEMPHRPTDDEIVDADREVSGSNVSDIDHHRIRGGAA